MSNPYATAQMLAAKYMTPDPGHSHTLYKSKDFTNEEYERRNRLAVAVIDGGLSVCKYCGAAEMEISTWKSCAAYRARDKTCET